MFRTTPRPSTGLPFAVDIANGIHTEQDDEQFEFPDGGSFDDDEQFGFADGESFDADPNPDLDNGTDLLSGALFRTTRVFDAGW